MLTLFSTHSVFFSLQIRDSRWLDDSQWSEPDHAYRAVPTRVGHALSAADNAPDDGVSKEEEAVRDKLHTLGINQELLESHIERGNRSQIIGTYRILMHR